VKLSAAALNAALTALGLDQTKASSNGWATAKCPACGPDERPSLRVNIDTGYYRCHRCRASSRDDGPPLDVFVKSPQSAGTVVTLRDLPPLSEDLIARYHRILVDSPQVVTDLERKRGWTKATIEKLLIGWDGSHLWIPIRDQSGKLINARMYDPFKRSTVKSFHYANDEGLNRKAVWIPFGFESIEKADEVWMFEGEPDGILAAQQGLPTLLITGGAGTWTADVLNIVRGKKVVLCYDIDTPGRRGARTVRSRLVTNDVEALHLDFSLSDPNFKDFSDAILKDKRSVSWFKKLANDQWEGKKDQEEAPPPLPVKLGGGVPKESISVKAHVLGTNMIPVLVPQLAEVKCHMNWDEKKCAACPVMRTAGSLRVEIDAESEMLMNLAVMNSRQQENEFRRKAGIPGRCPMVKFKMDGHWQIQHLKLIPPMSERHGGDSTMRAAMYVCPADGRTPPIRSNQLYHFYGKIEPDVLTNEWTLVSSDAIPAEDDIDSFTLDEEMTQSLKETFNPRQWTADSIDAVMIAEEKSLSRHVTGVFGRNNLLRLVDLTYHSVIRFKYRGKVPARGWLSLCVIGDTRTGKSETMNTMTQYFGLGKYVMDPANTTYAGIVGGLQQVGSGDKSWVVTWGLVPTNDRGLVTIDEASSLSVDDISKMSGMRSSGIAEITKIRNASTPARTRIIMAGNPRGLGRMLSSYGTPVEAIMDLIGTPEDVARFDFACAVKQGLDKEAADQELGEQPYPALVELRRALVRFAWSRTESHVEWEDGAENLAAKRGAAMAKEYDHSMPLVEPAEQDLKIARLAVASAARTFSVKDDDPNIIYVRRCHVEFAERVMRCAYDGELGYKEFSEYKKRQKLDTEAVIAAIVDVDPGDVGNTCRALLDLRRVNPNSIGMVLGLDGNEARMFITQMARNGAAFFDQENSRNTAMVWTSEFMNLLREMEKDPPKPTKMDMGF